MAIERRDPLPPGRYWVFLYTSELERWQAWVTANTNRVKVRASELQTTTPNNPMWGITPTGTIIKDPVGEAILFDVLQPVPWIGIGFPTIVKEQGSSPEAIMRAMTEIATAPLPEEGFFAAGLRQFGGLLLMGGALYLAVTLIHGNPLKSKKA